MEPTNIDDQAREIAAQVVALPSNTTSSGVTADEVTAIVLAVLAPVSHDGEN